MIYYLLLSKLILVGISSLLNLYRNQRESFFKTILLQ